MDLTARRRLHTAAATVNDCSTSYCPREFAVQLAVISCLLLLGLSVVTDGYHTSPNIVQLGTSTVPANGSFWDYKADKFLFQLIQVTTPGTLFAFSAAFRTSNPVEIIVWRPVNGTSDQFRVIWKLTVASSSLATEEFVYVEAKLLKECADVQTGDWIGLFSTSSPFPVAFLFVDIDQANYSTIYSTTWSNVVGPNISEVVAITRDRELQLEFPIKFLFSAYILPSANGSSSNSSRSTGSGTVRCPSGLIVTSSLRSTPATPAPTPVTGVIGPRGVTGQPGSTGELGPTGDNGTVGEDGQASNAIGAVGLTGSDGVNGTVGERGVTGNETGSDGTQGPSGTDGLTGPVGSNGSTGFVGPLGNNLTVWIVDQYGNYRLNNSISPNTGASSEIANFFDEPMAMTAVYIWLAIATGVTVVGLILLLVAIVYCNSAADILHDKQY